ncbi:alpha-L-rhamnosidase [Aeromicrobium chenweiae]|uniref:alpha-L-rhamnosidase n=1 Tax=Aeromicrobium chenweiae TaxID=2079793 RepID=A0A2S0WLC5_9ACTN|nr:alpha-L-rhamnosidase [Aeromicrobium chenweiae]AWB92107.1 hypothetical protein C3E78_07795 [Aeromicrobium chenweiae]TGN32956.1 hypothetical protein E4L97_09770 [Aeromicrobium chenweiae]
MTPHAPPPRHLTRLRAQLIVIVTVLGVMFAGSPAMAAPEPSGPSAVTLDSLKVERKTQPVGIDVKAPRFAWQIESSERDVRQESYRVRVTKDDKSVWDSGVVDSERSFDVAYDGPALEAASRYDWTVDVVTTAGETTKSSSFRTGLMNAKDWGDSTWIGATSPVDDALALWDNYTADFDFTIDAFSFGAFVRAPSASDALMWQVSVADGTPRLRPHRRVGGGYSLLENPGIDLSRFVTVDQLTKQSNKLSVTVSAGTDATSVTVVTRLNGQQVDSRVVTQAGTMQRGFVGLRSDNNGSQPERSRLHALTVTRTADGTVLAKHDFADGDNPFTAGTIVDGSLQLSGSVDTVLSPKPAAAPLMRKEFTVDKPVRNATYYVAAGGYADVSLNGAPISKDVLSPGFTDYDDRVQYAATDVTKQLHEGRNALGMELGRGFFGMTGGNVWRWESPPWHAEPRARGLLAIEYADGSTDRVVTDDSWTFHEGPTQFDDLYAGEVYRASAEIPGWDVDGFDDSSWRSVREVTGPKGTLVNQRQQPIRITEALPAASMTEPAKGVYVIKFPRVIAGVVEYTVTGPAGTTIRAAHGEKLRANGRVNMDNNGGFQSGFQTDQFILAGTGKPETWTPKFSYKGFQYIEVTGWPGDKAPPLSAFTAKLLHTDAERTGSFESSSATMNGTHDAVVNTLYNNIHGIVTDTPMFEKNGWTGDAAVGTEMFIRNLDVHELFAKWMTDIQDSREPNGAPMVIAPSSGNWGAWGPSQPWHSAYVNIPWWLYQYGGDDQVMTELYDGMKAYVDLEFGRRRADGTVISNRLGDWVSPEGSPAGGHAPGEDQRVEGTAYLYMMFQTMERTARHLGKTADASRFAERAQTVKTDFNKAYFDSADDRYRGEGDDGKRYRQVHNVLALQFGLTPDAATTKRVADRLAADVVKRDYHLDTGTLGTKYLLPVLTKYGHGDVAYKLATQTTYPSWGYKLANGATSMWEHWSLEARSLGHYFLGTVDDWFYTDVAGIRPSEEKGYREVTIAPQVTGEMTWAKATTQTPYGAVTSDWRRSGRSVLLTAKVPVGSTATVVLPGEVGSTILEAGMPAADAAGVRKATYADGSWTLTVGSGSYDFRVMPQADPERDVEASLSTAKDQVNRGDSATGKLTIDNFSPVDVSDVTVKVSGDSLRFTKDEFTVGRLSGDSSTSVDLEAEVAQKSPMGARDVTVTVSFSADGQQYSVTEKLPWITVVSGVDIEQVVAGGLTDPDGLTTTEITAEVTNSTSHPVSGRLVADRAGWATKASKSVTIPAGGSVQVTATVTPRRHVVTPSTAFDVVFVDDDVELAREGARVAASLTTPPAASVDHVDFGNNASETAHALQAASTSGTSSEAGLTRRYAHSQYPGSWFSAEVVVPKGQAFALRLRETFDGAKTKEFNLYADDVLVGRYEVPRTQTGNGWLAHQIIVDDPAVMAATADGKARLKFEFPKDARAGNFDPSIADAWVIEVPSADGPAVKAEVSKAGQDGWHGAGAALTLSSQDGATIRYRVGTGAWTDYTAAVPLAEGSGTVEFQARASDGLLGPIGVLTPKVDTTKPLASASVDEDRTVTITGEDLLSGVSTIEYRVDKGDWQVYAKPFALNGSAHQVTYRATDLAGNVGDEQVLDVPAGPLEAVVTADVSKAGKDGWHGAGATMTLTAAAADDEEDVTIRYRVDGGSWSEYTGPVELDEGLALVEYQAVSGDRTGVIGSTAVKVDATVPAVKVVVDDTRQLSLAATDALSGVDTVEYRVAGGEWATYTAPVSLSKAAQTVAYRATDLAGNTSAVRTVDVTAAPAPVPGPAPRVKKAPVVKGTLKAGRVLRTTKGAWDLKGLTYSRQWMRNGRAISGATATTYRLRTTDVGARISVKVTAAKSGHRNGSATTARTGKIRAASSRTALKANRRTLAPGQRLKVTTTVTSPGLRPGGRVQFYYRGKKVRTVTLKNGKVTTSFRPRVRGKHTLKAVYRGVKGIDGSRKSVTIRIR